MIHDLDKSLKALLQHLVNKRIVQEISFATPDDQFGPSLPAVNLFLYDVRENNDLRSNEWLSEWRRDHPGDQRLPPVRVDCSYLVTAWAGDIAEEHHVLGEVMRLLLNHPKIPEENLKGSLENAELPLPATALQPGKLQSPNEFWQALGGKPKVAFDFTVTIAMPALIIEHPKGRPVGKVIEEQITVAEMEWLIQERARRKKVKGGSPDWTKTDERYADTKMAKLEAEREKSKAGEEDG